MTQVYHVCVCVGGGACVMCADERATCRGATPKRMSPRLPRHPLSPSPHARVAAPLTPPYLLHSLPPFSFSVLCQRSANFCSSCLERNPHPHPKFRLNKLEEHKRRTRESWQDCKREREEEEEVVVEEEPFSPMTSLSLPLRAFLHLLSLYLRFAFCACVCVCVCAPLSPPLLYSSWFCPSLCIA